MRCPSLTDLPPSPPGKTGWPWTEESRRLPDCMPGGRPWPRITIVTPSFNQGQFLEEAIRSILLQGYPNLEYFVLDGGSRDASVDIIRKYAAWITFWVSEPDGGQSAAINRGLRMGSGLYAAWINSDDMLCKDALTTHASTVGFNGNFVYIGDSMTIDEAGRVLFSHRGAVRSLEDLVRVPRVWRADGYICQQEVLFPLELARRVGGLNESNHYSMDYELWGEFFLAGAAVQYTGIPFGYFRWHPAQKTQETLKQTASMLDAAAALTRRCESFSPALKQEILTGLEAYGAAYPKEVWKGSGRLARLGLPPSIVLPLRSLMDRYRRVWGI